VREARDVLARLTPSAIVLDTVLRGEDTLAERTTWSASPPVPASTTAKPAFRRTRDRE